MFNHTLAGFIWQWGNISIRYWLIADFYGAIIRFAVPVFIILSGYLLLDKQEDDVLFYKKRFSKIAIPLVVWSIVYMIFKTHSIYSIFSIDFLKEFLSGTIIGHLYFLYAISGLYVITPALRRILSLVLMRDVYLFIIIWFISNPIYSLLSTFGFGFYNLFDMATGLIGYYVLGYVIKKTDITSKTRILAGVTAVISMLVIFGGSGYFTIMQNQVDSSFTNGLTLPVVIYSSSLFVFLEGCLQNINFSKYSKQISALSNSVMGIYLVHLIFLQMISSDKIFHLYSFNPLYSIPIIVTVLFIVSFLSVYILQKIPYGKYIVP